MPLNIKELREKHRFSQQDLAEKTGIPKGRINNWEQGKGQPKATDYNTLKVFFEALEIQPSYLKLQKGGGGNEPEPIPFYDAIATAGLTVLQADQAPASQPSERVAPGTWFRAASAAKNQAIGVFLQQRGHLWKA